MGGGPLEESPLESAKRELKEETGISALHWEEVLHIYLSNSITDEEGYAYVAKNLAFGEQTLEETEDISLKKVHLKETLAMCLDGRIKDGFTVTCILRLAQLEPHWFE